MGRPRKHFAGSYRLVTDVTPDVWKRVRERCRAEKLSIRKLLASLVAGYLEHPVYWIRYLDPVVFERVDRPADYHPVVRECLGWLDSQEGDVVRIVWDRSVSRLPNEKPPAGSNGLTVPKSAVVELRRLTSS
jgi:hypothetical protein